MFVERRFSEETTAGIRNLRVGLTNEYQHNALRSRGKDVLDHLPGMLRGER